MEQYINKDTGLEQDRYMDFGGQEQTNITLADFYAAFALAGLLARPHETDLAERCDRARQYGAAMVRIMRPNET